jgi:hypothetical protein
MDSISKTVVLLGGVRSGTTVFREFLATHPKLINCGEIFNSNHRDGFFPFLSSLCLTNTQAIIPENQESEFEDYLISRCTQCGENAPIVDIKYEHLRLLHRPWETPFATPLLLEFIKQKQLSVIHLRRNPVDAVISNFVAIHRGIYHKSSANSAATESPGTLTIDPRAFAQQIRQRIKVTRFISKFFVSYEKCLQLDYEDLFDLSSGQAVFSARISDKISDKLAIENEFDRHPKLQKVIDVPRESLISNYTELDKAIARYDNYFQSAGRS